MPSGNRQKRGGYEWPRDADRGRRRRDRRNAAANIGPVAWREELGHALDDHFDIAGPAGVDQRARHHGGNDADERMGLVAFSQARKWLGVGT